MKNANDHGITGHSVHNDRFNFNFFVRLINQSLNESRNICIIFCLQLFSYLDAKLFKFFILSHPTHLHFSIFNCYSITRILSHVSRSKITFSQLSNGIGGETLFLEWQEWHPYGRGWNKIATNTHTRPDLHDPASITLKSHTNKHPILHHFILNHRSFVKKKKKRETWDSLILETQT